MKKDLPAYVYRKGRKGYLYFTRFGKTTRMHETPGTAEFAAEYARIMAGRAPVEAKSILALIEDYKRSPKFTDKSPRTQKDYEKVLTYIAAKFGPHKADAVERRHIIAARDANAKTRRFATYIVQVMSILMEHAIDLGWRVNNPAKGAGYAKVNTEGRDPWPADKVAAFRSVATGRTLLIFELCIGTGQRISDVLRMQWNDIQDGCIRVRQGKTGAKLFIPLTSRLHGILDSTPKKGLTICAQDNGKPTSYRGAEQLVATVREKIGAKAHRIHDLRHTAASELVAAGCSDELIMAVTGHKSAAMVARYTKGARQKARAIEAIGKLKSVD